MEVYSLGLPKNYMIDQRFFQLKLFLAVFSFKIDQSFKITLKFWFFSPIYILNSRLLQFCTSAIHLLNFTQSQI